MLLVLTQGLQAKIASIETLRDTTKKIIVENANNQVIDNTTIPPIRYFNGDVRAYHDGSFFFCDSAKIVNNTMYAYGNVVIIQHDTITIFADELFYDGDSLFSYLRSNVVLENNDDQLFTEYLEYDMKIQKAYYRDRAMMKSGNSTLKSRKGTFDVKNNTAWFENRVTVDGEDFHMVTDSLSYNTKEEIATWTTPALIKQDSSDLYSKKGKYATRLKYAEFTDDAQYKKNDIVATADKIVYDGFKKEVKLLGKARYQSLTELAVADSIQYNEETEYTTLQGKASFENATNKANGDFIVYDKVNDNFKLKGKGQIRDSSMIIDADYLDYNKKTKLGIATGNVYWRDTTSKTSILADSIYLKGEVDYMTASNKKGKPLLTTLIDGDTLYMSADTLRRQRVYRQIDSLHMDTVKVLLGDNHVEIFKSDLQAIADSIIFNELDSVFVLYDHPVLWSDTTQMHGDTINIYLKNKKIDYLELVKNSLIINSPDLLYFNQIKGNKIVANFKDSQMDKLKVTGNAQCLYYMQDDNKAYLGVNQTDCSLMIFQFVNKKIDNIRFYTEPTSVLSPMDKVDHDKIKLKGFQWKFDQRPLSMSDLFQ